MAASVRDFYDVDACICMWVDSGRKLVHWGLEPASVLHLDFQLDAQPAEPSLPLQLLVKKNFYFFL